MVRFSHTSSREHLHFVWRIDSDDNESGMLQKNEEISSNLKSAFPKYFSRAMKLQFLEKFGRINKDKPSILREIYKNLTGDYSADSNQHESEIHERIKEVLDAEDDQLIWNLRINNGRPEQYIPFLEQCQKYIAAKVETAVDEPTNTNGEVITHMATALNARTLYDEGVKQCPEGTDIPSKKWLKWKFWPRNAGNMSSRRYTG